MQVRIIFLHFAINIIRFSIAMHFRGTVLLGNAVMYDVTQQIQDIVAEGRAVAVTIDIDAEAVKAFTAADDEKEAVKATRERPLLNRQLQL